MRIIANLAKAAWLNLIIPLVETNGNDKGIQCRPIYGADRITKLHGL